MYRMTDEEFEVAIAEALDAMPEQFMEALRNVAIVWEEEPSAYHLGHDEEWGAEMRNAEGEDEFDDLLGLFDGLSIVERANGYERRYPRRHYRLQRPPRALLRQPRGNRRRGRQDHHPRAGPLLRPQ